MKRRLTSITLLVSLSLALAGSARAANYSFRLQKETVNIYWQSDGTATLDYVFVFANDSGAAPIDYVDVGLPTAAYRLSDVSADVNSSPISDIEISTYVQFGVALGLGPAAIAPGATGTVHALIRGIGQLLYPDDQDPAYVSAVFSPAWFDASLVHGQTDLTVIFHLPPGVQPAEPRYHAAPAPFPAQPEAALDNKGQVTYTWYAANADGSTQYALGASFPAKYVAASAIATRPVAGTPLSGTQAAPTAAPAYSFRVITETVLVAIHNDGTVMVDYALGIANDAAAPPLDVLEVSLPNTSLALTYAEVNGHPVAKSRPAGATTGVILKLEQAAIPPGATAQVHVYTFDAAQMLQPDGQHPGYFEGVLTLTRFNPKNVHGPTDLTVTFRLPTTLAASDVIVPTPAPAFTSQLELVQAGAGSLSYSWHNAQADASADYALRLSFPATAIVHPSPTPHSLVNDMQQGTGWGALVDVCGLVLAFFSVIGGLMGLTHTPAAPVRRLQYLPPQITIEGKGIKRGLTAVEAAVLLERPLDTVLTMILFGVLRKGAARITSAAPLAVEVSAALPDDLHDYERDFLKAFRDDKARRADNLQAMMVGLVKSVSEKMRGFSRKETLDYYQGIVEKAWQDVQAADTPEVKGQKFDELMDWTLLDRDFEARSGQALGSNLLPLPVWWGRYAPFAHMPGGPAAPAAASPSAALPGLAAPSRPAGLSAPDSLPSLPGADYAAAIASSVQGFSAQAVGDLERFTSKISNQTNPAPVSAASGYSGGGHCACACACAGCACACAGGGR
jgi:hypothetical protein